MRRATTSFSPSILWRHGFSAQESRRLRLFSNLGDTIYITASDLSRYLSVNLHGIPIAPGANSEVKCCVYAHSLWARNSNDIIDTKRFLYPHR